MLRFKVYENGAPARQVDLTGAHLLGPERVPVRGELRFEKGEILCETRSRAAAALAIVWPVKGFGRVMLETPRLLERREPYNLVVELTRGQLMRISLKREDWGLYDYPEGEPVYRAVDAARDLLLEAMTAGDDATAFALAEQALSASVTAGESVGNLHAEAFLARRRTSGQLPPRPIGCRLSLDEVYKAPVAGPIHPQRLPRGFDFVSVPMSWRYIEAVEGKASLAAIEPWVRAIRERKLQLWAGSLLSFDEMHRPAWWSGGAKEYDRLRDAAARHMKQVAKALAPHVSAWEVAAGLHARNPLKLNLEQIIDLTRMAMQVARQAAPKVPAILTICPPWGDYYANDHQTIPPLLYAEMAIQSGIAFDAFGLEIRFGGEGGPRYVRDMMQISALLDRYGGLGKAIHVSAAGVPSAPPCADGSWHGEWSEDVQSQWLRDFYRIALSKPFVESVSWHGLADAGETGANGGLLRGDLTPKPAYHQLLSLREEICAGRE
ncbi:MAG: hypothetical protein DCC65_03595 [Planctomycetota bacterium]|nr:MAG: hypothetical protein DCC65_03595 [Planctomycetota bacterium]